MGFFKNRNSYARGEAESAPDRMPEPVTLPDYSGFLTFNDDPEYSPHFGRRSELFDDGENTKRSPSVHRGIDDETTAYLEKIGRLDQAQKWFDVRIAVPGKTEPVTIRLTGASRSRDALARLYEMGYLISLGNYRFNDWPSADPVIGPWYHHVSACVCELTDRIYHIEEYSFDDIQPMYGCPNVFEQTDLSLKKTVEVVDYVQ